MPTFERRSYLTLFINEKNKREELIEEAREGVDANGKRRISGDTLKNKLKNGEIPDV